MSNSENKSLYEESDSENSLEDFTNDDDENDLESDTETETENENNEKCLDGEVIKKKRGRKCKPKDENIIIEKVQKKTWSKTKSKKY